MFIDTSAYTLQRYPQALVHDLRSNGRRKVLFGSHWPMIAPAKALAALPALALDDETRDLLLGADAKRVFRL